MIFLQVEAGLKYIERMPEINSIGYKGTRKHLIKKFPYKIIYILEHGKAIVLAVLHGKRSEKLLKGRVETI